MKKLTPQEAIDEFEREFEEEMKLRREIHRQTMDGLVRPMIEQGLVDLEVEEDGTEER